MKYIEFYLALIHGKLTEQECYKYLDLIKELTSHLALLEVFVKMDKIIATPENPVTFLAGEEAALLHFPEYQNLKKQFGVDKK
jgi:hypothetical protein